MNRRFGIAFFALLCAASVGACSSMPQRVRDAINGAALPAQTGEERVHGAMQLLEDGHEDSARAQLETVLRQEPGNAMARQLLDQINTDPRTLLGARSHAYVARQDDTMSGLAQRFLGDPLMFYALARYNNMAPSQLQAGATLQIPDRGRPTITASARAPAAAPSPSVSSAPAVSVSVDDAARANRLRLQGLEHLNAGDADTAVTLLRQARALDAANPAIQNDLNRAQRIQASVHRQ